MAGGADGTHRDAAQDEAKKASAVSCIESLEGSGIPAAVGEHELFVGALHGAQSTAAGERGKNGSHLK